MSDHCLTPDNDNDEYDVDDVENSDGDLLYAAGEGLDGVEQGGEEG